MQVRSRRFTVMGTLKAQSDDTAGTDTVSTFECTYTYIHNSPCAVYHGSRHFCACHDYVPGGVPAGARGD